MKKEQVRKIWEGRKKVFLVCDKSFRSLNAPFFDFLWNEGFALGSHHGNYGCEWIYIDITIRQYAYGMPGVEVVGAIGNHAITINEFMKIYNIYKKYENKGIFVFNKQRFDYEESSFHD